MNIVRKDERSITTSGSDKLTVCTPHLVKNIGDDTAIVLISIYTENDNNLKLI